MKNLSEQTPVRVQVLNEFSDSYGVRIVLNREFYSNYVYSYCVIKFYPEKLQTVSEKYYYDVHQDAVSKFMYLINSVLIYS